MVGFLFTQTQYSLLDNTISIENLVAQAKEYGYTTLSIADNNCVYGALKFYYECQKNGIKPIIGIKASIEGVSQTDTTMLLYAKNLIGYRNILKISSLINIKECGFVTFEELKRYREGIFAVSIPNSEVGSLINAGNFFEAKKLIKSYLEVFEEFYMGLMPQSTFFEVIASDYVDMASEMNIGMMPLHRACYLNKEDLTSYKYLSAIKTGHLDDLDGDYSFSSMDSIEKEFLEYPFVFDTISEVIKNINLEIPKASIVIPKYPTPNGEKQVDYLYFLANKGLKRRLELASKNLDEEKYITRLNYELDVITKMHYEDYFLVVWDYVKFAKKKQMLVGPGRGSAAGSLVAYSLGITDVDPLAYNLLFERFLNPERISMPDIDVDFPDDRRDEVIKYVAEKYGIKRVAHIVTFGTFQAKLALRDIAKVMKIQSYKVDNVLKFIPLNFNLAKYQENDTLMALTEDNEVQMLLEIASKIYGLPKNTSTHAAGIIMSNSELTDFTALTNGLDGIYQTQYEASDLESLGLLKMDFLGLRNLKMLNQIITLIEKDKPFDIRLIPLDDRMTYETLKRADTSGIFQLESYGIKKVLRKLMPTNIEDIIAVLALYRPGPMDNIDEYIARKNGKKYTYLSPLLEPILESTYGIIVYQEQIMLIAQKFAGYTLGEADILRRAVSKKHLETLELEREKFTNKSSNMGYSVEQANSIYDYIVKFANYGFNRSHTVAYSLISYQMAFLKTHYRKYFMAVLLDGVIGDLTKTQEYMNGCLRYGIKVTYPDINLSNNKYVIDGSIRFPLNGIKNVGEALANTIIKEREKGQFKDVLDFTKRVNVSQAVLENLVFAHCFDFLGIAKKAMLDLHKESDLLSSVLDEINEDDTEYDNNYLIQKEKEAIGFIFDNYQKLK